MAAYKYTVVVKEKGEHFPIMDRYFDNKNVAINYAEKWAKEYPSKNVFIEFYRKSDGQEGYINRDGFDITGKSWTE